MTRAEFTEAVFTFAALSRGSVTSWIRTAKHNDEVTGVPHSAHLYGLAADVTYDAPVTIEDATDRAKRLGMRLLREKDHDHLQPLDWQPG